MKALIMKNISLQQIRYFRIVMGCSSFSQAAEIAYTSQANISKNIKALEEALGEELFIRQKRGVLPTQKAILFNIEVSEIEQKLNSLFPIKNQDLTETITIGFCQSINFQRAIPSLFSLLSSDLFAQNTNFVFCCEDANDIVSGIASDKYDIGFILSDMEVTNPNLRIQDLIMDTPKIYFSKDCDLNSKQKITLEDLAAYPVVTTKFLIQQNEYKMINALPFNPNGICIVNSYADIPLYLATGKYITVLRPFVYLAYDDNICSYSLPSYNLKQGITMIWKNTNHKDGVRKVTDKLLRELQKSSEENSLA